MHLKARALGIFLVLGHPFLFGMYFCLKGMIDFEKSKLVTSLIGEALAATVCVWLLLRSLTHLATIRFTPLEPNARLMVVGACLLCVVLASFNLGNAASSGLLAEGGNKLEFYFANDWFRRLVTFSYIPLVVGAYYSMYAILSPLCRRRRAIFITFLIVQLVSSLLAGSKGAAIVFIAGATPFVFTIRPLPVAKMIFALSLATCAYLAIFLSLSSDPTSSLLTIFLRFYLSIDMSILLVDADGTAQVIASRLGDVWVEIFRNLGSLGIRTADEPIGVMIFQYVLGSLPTVGSNCRFASLLLLYPDRLDFLILYPVLVTMMAVLLGEILKAAKLPRAALVAIPCFAFTAFQDTYWFTTHVIPIVLAFSSLQVAKSIKRRRAGGSGSVGSQPVQGVS
jgi:hypothetical protein